MSAGPVSRSNGFGLTGKKHAVFYLHTFAAATAQLSVYFIPFMPTQRNTAPADQMANTFPYLRMIIHYSTNLAPARAANNPVLAVAEKLLF